MHADDVPFMRLRNLGLLGTPPKEGPEVVRRLAAMQSQDYGPAKWSVAQRTRSPGDSAIEADIAAGRILRTHVLRPTWHLVAPEDIRWMLQLTAPRVRAMTAGYYRELDLDGNKLTRAEAAIVDALQGGNHMTRPEIAEVLGATGLDTDKRKVAYCVMHAELNATICSGAPRGKQQTYALLEERAAAVASLSDEEALAEITRRYFVSHGPATANDLSWWSSLTVGQVRRGLEMVSAELKSASIGDDEFWFAPGRRPTRSRTPKVHLLQPFDEYFVGYRQSRHLVEQRGLAWGRSETPGAFTAAVVLDGQLVGRWRRATKSDHIDLSVQLAIRLDGAESAALESAVDAYARFAGLPVTLKRT